MLKNMIKVCTAAIVLSVSAGALAEDAEEKITQEALINAGTIEQIMGAKENVERIIAFAQDRLGLSKEVLADFFNLSQDRLAEFIVNNEEEVRSLLEDLNEIKNGSFEKIFSGIIDSGVLNPVIEEIKDSGEATSTPEIKNDGTQIEV